MISAVGCRKLHILLFKW